MTDPAPQSSFVVFSTGGKYDILPPSAQAILGEYVEEGQNHGKRTYRRTPSEAQKGLGEVFIFYWDARDGKELTGWWFGDKIGGGQVWARCTASAELPPQKGWRCPVDGPVLKALACVPKVRPKQELVVEQGQKRPFEAEEPEGPTKHARVEAEAFTLHSSLGRDAPDRIRALSGRYQRRGFNHGRRTYFQSDAGCWLYYWDKRDGADFSGWWLGRRVGGAEVFGLAKCDSTFPPESSWQIPHDAVKPRRDVTLTIASEEDEEEEELEERPESAKISEEERLAQAKELLTKAGTASEKAIETSKSVLDADGDPFEEGVRAVVELLNLRLLELERAQASLERHAAAAKEQRLSKTADAELTFIGEQLDQCLGSLQKEASRAQEELTRLETTSAEERDARAFEKALPLLMEAVSQAELQVGSSESQTQIQLSAASEAVARELAKARSFAPQARQLAMKEFGDLQQRCRKLDRQLDLTQGLDRRMDLSTETHQVDAEEVAAPRTPEVAEGNDTGSLNQITARVEEMEAGAQRVLETSKMVLAGDVDDKGLEACLELLEDRSEGLSQAQKDLSRRLSAERAKNRDLGEELEEFSGLRSLAARLRSLRTSLQAEASAARRKAESSKRRMEAEWDAMAAMAAMPELRQAVTRATEAVEAVIFQAGDLDWRRTQMETAMKHPDEFGDDIEKALEETQELSDKAQALIDIAGGRLEIVQEAAANGLVPSERKAAANEAAGLQECLEDAQRRLRPYMHIRADLELQLAAKEELEGISGQMLSLEDEIEQVQSLLASAITSATEAEAVEQALDPLGVELENLRQVLQTKFSVATGEASTPALRSQLRSLEGRANVAAQALAALAEEGQALKMKASGDALLSEAQQDFGPAAVLAEKLKELGAENELLTEEEAASALAAAEGLVASESQLRGVRARLEERLQDSRKLPQGSLRMKITLEIQALVTKVDAISLQFKELKVETFARRTKRQMQDAVVAVHKAEEAVKEIMSAAGPLSEDLEKSSPGSFGAVAARVAELCPAAEASCAAAKEAIDKRQADPKQRESPSFNLQFSKLALRLSDAEEQLKACRSAAQEAEGNRGLLKAKKAELGALEQQVEEAELQTTPLGDEVPIAFEAFKKLWGAQLGLETWLASAKSLQSNPHVGLKLAVSRLLQQGNALCERLQEAKSGSIGWAEALGQLLPRQGTDQVAAVEAALGQAETVEGPFLKGLEDLPEKISRETLALCEAEAAKTGKLLEKAEFFMDLSCREASAVDAVIPELQACAAKLLKLKKKLKQYCEDTARRKAAGKAV